MNLDWFFSKEINFDRNAMPVHHTMESTRGIPLQKILKGENEIFHLSSVFTVDQVISDRIYAIDFGTMFWADEIYLNGNFIGKTGSFFGRPWNHWLKKRVYSFPAHYLNQGENRIFVRLFVGYQGGISKKVRLGFFSDMVSGAFVREFFSNTYFEYIFVLFCFLGLYQLVLFIERRGEKSYLFYSLFSFSYACLSFSYISYADVFFPFDYIYLLKLMLSSIFLCILFLKIFMFYFFNKSIDKISLFTLFLFNIFPIIIIMLMPTYSSLRISQAFILPLALPGVFMLGYIAYYGLKDQRMEAKWMMIGLFLVCICVCLDIYTSLSEKLEKVYLSGLGISAFTISFLFLIARRDSNNRSLVESLNQKLKKINESLEERVRVRTLEATNQLEEIQNLKRNQDADYFLTSLISEPLCINANTSKSVITEILVSQKKKFQHGNLKGEIGGDISITGNVELGAIKERYIVFFNADAMGKSLQGAGGAIVAGTAINSLITRSKILSDKMLLSPEEWLEDAYHEMKQLFDTFNGLMSLSAVMGLIHEATGRIIYFNADHPFPVLFRNGQASHILEQIVTRKLGSLIDGDFAIFHFQLQKGDFLLIGSDGKDDIRSLKDNSILDDPENFLRIVENAEADLVKMYEIIGSSSIITDDISFIKISFEK